MTPFLAAIVWALGVVLWVAIRMPHRRRARKTATVDDRKSVSEWFSLSLTIIGLVVFPAVYLVTDLFNFADRSFIGWIAWLGLLVQITFVVLFYKSHRDLGRNWSVTLEIREGHQLVTNGVFRYVRHPMYSSFWLWALAQALLLPNWIAGLSGLVTITWLYFTRIEKEEAMMRETFGTAYEEYSHTTGRLLPRIGAGDM